MASIPMKYRRLQIEGDALVVTFDICSSTSVLEQLILRGDVARYKQLLTAVKEFLAREQEAVPFEPYKFNGDGWILLFPEDTNGDLLFGLLQRLCTFFETEFNKTVLRHLDSGLPTTGLTFGIETGPLTPMTIYGQREYVGRAINVACRLQAAIKDGDKAPAYKALVSNAAYRKYLSRASKSVKVWKVSRKLRNIQGGVELAFLKVEFLKPRGE